MLRVTLKSVRGHLVRFLLTAIAVTLGVAFVAGTFVLRDSIDATLDDLLGGATKGVDVQVRGKESVEDGGFSTRASMPVALADTLAKVDGVQRAVPDLQGSIMLVGKDGKVVRSGGAPTLGFAFRDDDPSFRLVEGRGPTGPTEVAVESSTLERSELKVGDSTQAVVGSQPTTVTIVGRVDFGSLFGATAVLTDAQTATKQFAPDGLIGSFSVTATPGVTQAALAERVRTVLPGDAEAITGAALKKENEDAINKGLTVFTSILLIFAAVSLFVGIFIIFNTFSMLITQRTRELALLRAVGAARGQVLRMVLGEAVVVGIVGSGLGLAAGVGLAAGLQALMRTVFGADISSGVPVHVVTVVTSLVVGTVVTLLSALLPALRASRIPPVAAMREDAIVPKTAILLRGLIGSAVLAFGAGAVVLGVTRADVPWPLVGVGSAMALIGALMAAPLVARPVVRVVSAPIVLVTGLVGRLARENALRVPRRTATTASALMIGLALIAAVSVIADSAKASVRDVVVRELRGDFVVTSGFSPVPPGTADALAKADGVRSATAYTSVPLAVDGETAPATALSGAAVSDVLNLRMDSGAVSDLGVATVLVDSERSAEEGWRTGDTITATVGALKDQRLKVAGIYEPSAILATDFIVDRSLFEKAVPAALRFDQAVIVAADEGADLSQVRAALDAVAKPYVALTVQSAQEFTDGQVKQIDTLLNFLYALLLLSVVIAVLGIINTLALSVFERTREIGLLRAVGLSRRQLASMITVESVTTAAFGAALGLALGLGAGIALQHGLRGDIDTLSIPWGRILVVLAASAVTGVVAALWPAIRAVRLNVLRAIATD
ncbi:MAG: ABC transporter permease [Kineosporiaceae bacterium]